VYHEDGGGAQMRGSAWCLVRCVDACSDK
jgi:hypothetical protein